MNCWITSPKLFSVELHTPVIMWRIQSICRWKVDIQWYCRVMVIPNHLVVVLCTTITLFISTFEWFLQTFRTKDCWAYFQESWGITSSMISTPSAMVIPSLEQSFLAMMSVPNFWFLALIKELRPIPRPTSRLINLFSPSYFTRVFYGIPTTPQNTWSKRYFPFESPKRPVLLVHSFTAVSSSVLFSPKE